MYPKSDVLKSCIVELSKGDILPKKVKWLFGDIKFLQFEVDNKCFGIYNVELKKVILRPGLYSNFEYDKPMGSISYISQPGNKINFINLEGKRIDFGSIM